MRKSREEAPSDNESSPKNYRALRWRKGPTLSQVEGVGSWLENEKRIMGRNTVEGRFPFLGKWQRSLGQKLEEGDPRAIRTRRSRALG